MNKPGKHFLPRSDSKKLSFREGWKKKFGRAPAIPSPNPPESDAASQQPSSNVSLQLMEPAAAPQQTIANALPRPPGSSPASQSIPEILPPSAPVAIPNHHPTLFADALAKLDEKDRDLIKKHSNDQINELQASFKHAVKLQEQCDKQVWKWQFRGHEVIPSKMASTICKLLKQVESSGNTLAGLDPIHAGIPWAAIKIIVELSLAMDTQRSQLMTGLEYVLFYSKRLELYIRLPSYSIHETLVNIYACILKFLAAAIRTLEMNRLRKTVQALLTAPALTNFVVELEECRNRLRADVQDEINEEIRVQLGTLDAMQTTVMDTSEKLDLASLKWSAGAKYNSYENEQVSECLQGTRVDVIRDIMDWTESPQQRIFWLCGKAGTGKSTVAKTVATKLQKRQTLVTFFFKRGRAGRNTAQQLFPTLVRQLTDMMPSLKPHVAKALREDSSICDAGLNTQFLKLLEQPLNDCHTVANIYVVLDALDECSRQDVKAVLTLLYKLHVPGIQLHIFVTSRPDVEDAFKDITHLDKKLEEVPEAAISHDLRLFIDHQFNSMKSHHHDWRPEEQQLVALTKLSVPLFIAASTYCQYISKMPTKRLAEIVQQRPDIDDIYLPILCNMAADDPFNMDLFREVVGAIVLVNDPLPVHALVKLLDTDLDYVKPMLNNLESILNIEDGITFHLSFRDFLLDPKKPHDFCIDRTQTHDNLFRHCIRLLDTLEYDICHVGHIGTLRDQCVPEIALEMQYACRYWSLYASDEHEVEIFFRRGLLHWLEAMSWLDSIPQAVWDLTALSRRWPSNQFLTDSVRFLVAQQTPIELAPLQVYITALHCTSSRSLVKQCYITVFEERAKPWFDKIPDEVPHETATWTRPYQVHSACLSHDKQFVALFVDYCTVRHCEVATGTTRQSFETDLINPLYGDAYMAYSQDDSTLTVSSNGAIVICDIDTGAMKSPCQLGAEIIALAEDGTMAITVHDDRAALDHESGVVYTPPYTILKTVSLLHIASGQRTVLICGTGSKDVEKAKFSSFQSSSIVLLTDIVHFCDTDRNPSLWFRIWTMMSNMLPALRPNDWTVDYENRGRDISFSLSQSGLLAVAWDGWGVIFDVLSGDQVCDFECMYGVTELQFIQHDEAVPALLIYDHTTSVQIFTISGSVAKQSTHGSYPGRVRGLIIPLDSYHSAVCGSNAGVSMSVFVPDTSASALSELSNHSISLNTGLRPDYFYASSGSKVQLWHVDGYRIGGMLDHGTDVGDVVLTPDHMYGLTTSASESSSDSADEAVVKVWSTKSSTVIKQTKMPRELRGRSVMALSPGGDLLAAADALVDVRSGLKKADLPELYYKRASFSQDSRYLCVADEGHISKEYTPENDKIDRLLSLRGLGTCIAEEKRIKQKSAHRRGLGDELSIIRLRIYDLHDDKLVTSSDQAYPYKTEMTDVHWAGQCLSNQIQCPGVRCDVDGHEIHLIAAECILRDSWLMYGEKRFLCLSSLDGEKACAGRTFVVARSLEDVSFYRLRNSV